MDRTGAAASTSPIVHLKRAFGWNVGKVRPSAAEVARLEAAGVTDPATQRYAAWRRSLLLAALVPAALAAALAVLDAMEDGWEGLTTLGLALEVAWIVAVCSVPVACLLALRTWVRPGRGARVLLGAWLVTFLLPLAWTLVPAEDLVHVEAHEPSAAAVSAVEDAGAAAGVDLEDVGVAEKLAAVEEITIEFVYSGAMFLMLLPAVLSLIPGAVNGCLRIKSAFPAAQLPGWLLVTVAPAFLLFWLVMLVLVSPAVEGPLLVLGILLWAGSPLVYALRGRVMTRAQIGPEEEARIGRAKRTAGLVGLAGLTCMVAFVLTTTFAGLHVLGEDEERAMSTRLQMLMDSDDEVGIEDVQQAYADSEALVYAYDLGSWRFVVDLIAKMLLATAVFADLVLRALLASWRNDRDLRGRSESGGYDASAAAASAAVSGA